MDIESPVHEETNNHLITSPELQESEIPLHIKKTVSKKEKEKKVMDFKFRTIELLEIFVQKSKNPEIFLVCLTPIIDCIKENLNDSKKQIFIEKIGNLIRKFFEKHLGFSVEVLSNLQECLSHIIFVNAKINSKKTSKIFENIICILIKVILQIRNDEETQKFVLGEYEKSLRTYAMKKDIFYSHEFFKQFIKNHFTLALSLTNTLISFCNLTEDGGARDDYRRSFVINLLSYLISFKSEANIDKKKFMIEENIEGFTKFVTVCFEKNSQLKKHKVAYLNKVASIAICLNKHFENDKNKKVEKFRLNIVKKLDNLEISDKNINKIKNNLLNHLK